MASLFKDTTHQRYWIFTEKKLKECRAAAFVCRSPHSQLQIRNMDTLKKMAFHHPIDSPIASIYFLRGQLAALSKTIITRFKHDQKNQDTLSRLGRSKRPVGPVEDFKFLQSRIQRVALILFQRMFVFRSPMQFNPALSPSMAFMLAIKAEDAPQTLIKLAHPEEPTHITVKEFMDLEVPVLDALRFHLHICLPQEVLEPMKAAFRQKMEDQEMPPSLCPFEESAAIANLVTRASRIADDHLKLVAFTEASLLASPTAICLFLLCEGLMLALQEAGEKGRTRKDIYRGMAGALLDTDPRVAEGKLRVVLRAFTFTGDTIPQCTPDPAWLPAESEPLDSKKVGHRIRLFRAFLQGVQAVTIDTE